MNKIIKLIVSIGLPFIAGAIGNIATLPNISTWYASLIKPSFNPPNWVFGPVWTILYILMGVSLYLLWVSPSKKDKRKAFIFFGIQLALNTLWSVVFFGLHSPLGGLIVILSMIIAILLTIRFFWQFSKMASYLLLPYLLWVCFATALNAAIFILN